MNVLVAVCFQFGEEGFVESDTGEFGGRVIGAAVRAQQTGHRANCHNVATVDVHHAGQKGLGGLHTR